MQSITSTEKKELMIYTDFFFHKFHRTLIFQKAANLLLTLNLLQSILS